METAPEGCRKDEELREEARKRWNTCQREQRQCHEESQFGIGGVQSVVIFQRKLMGTQCHNRDNGEDGEIGKQVNQYVVHQ